MDFSTAASKWMLSPPRRPAVILTYDVSPPISNQIISTGCWLFPCKFHQDCSSSLWDFVVTRSFRINERTNGWMDGRTDSLKSIMPFPTL